MDKLRTHCTYVAGLLLLAAGCANTNNTAPDPSQNTTKTSTETNQTITPTNAMTITSTAFEHNELIPAKYTCDGENINPPLTFSNLPQNAKSFVLLMDDPDVPKNLKPDGVFDHWVVYNIPPTTKEFAENSAPPGTQGTNGAGKAAYTGPCPPDREHRYFFKLYALDTELDFPNPPSKSQVEQAMQGHIIAQSELMGRYNKQR